MRAVLAALAVLFMLAGTVSAADTLGGTLGAGGDIARVTSTSTVTVRVTLTGDYVTATPSTFTLEPGESANATLTGPAKGDLSALLEPVAVKGDSGAARLVVHLTPAAPPPTDYSGALTALLAALGALLVAWRVKPWQYRLARRT